MQQHHRDAIGRWAEAAAADDEVLAVVVAGSLTKGYGLPESDVDGFEEGPIDLLGIACRLVLFREWPQALAGWSTQFMLDSEWNRLDREPPIDDL